MKKHTLTIAILFIWCSSVFPQEPVKFSTKQTRELWQICSESFRNLNPSMGPNIYYPVCDCYVDHIRNNCREQCTRGYCISLYWFNCGQ